MLVSNLLIANMFMDFLYIIHLSIWYEITLSLLTPIAVSNPIEILNMIKWACGDMLKALDNMRIKKKLGLPNISQYLKIHLSPTNKITHMFNHFNPPLLPIYTPQYSFRNISSSSNYLVSNLSIFGTSFSTLLSAYYQSHVEDYHPTLPPEIREIKEWQWQ